MTCKQIKELREDLNKHQSETKDTIKKEKHELKMTAQIKKEELNKDKENLRRKNQTQVTPEAPAHPCLLQCYSQ
jgi:hypothetical protein